MTATPVGMRCPECANRSTQQVRTARTMHDEPRVTYALIALNVIAFFAEMAGGGGAGFNSPGGSVIDRGALYGPAVEDGEYWRLITGGFLHAGLIHILFNMYLLYVLGTMLEPALGSVRFAAIYFTSLLFGSFGALLLDPGANTVGASGAVFGLMGAAFIELRRRGFDPMQSGIGGLLVLNLAITFLIPGISIGGHVGGLIGGVLGALAIQAGERLRSTAVALAACGAIAAVAVVGGIIAAGSPSLY